MAFHSALLTGVFELMIIIVAGVWISSLFTHSEESYVTEAKDRNQQSYLDRDREYLDEQMDIVQQEHEER